MKSFNSLPPPWVGGLLVGLVLAIGGCATAPTFDEARGFESQGRLVEALVSYERALAGLSGQDRSPVVANIDRLRRLIADQTLAAVGAARGGEDTIAGLRRALEIVRPNQAYGDGRRLADLFSELEQRLAARQAEYDRALAGAEQAATGSDWLSALAGLTRAEVIAGGGVEFGAKRAAWIARRDESMAAKIRASLGDRQLAQAEALLKEFSGALPAPEASLMLQLTGAVTELRHSLFLEAQQALVGRKRYFMAYRNLLKAEFPAARTYLESVRRDGARHYLEVARQELGQNVARVGYAYFAAAKAKEMDGEQEDIFKFHRDLSDMIENLITIRIAISGFDSPAAAPGVGNQVSDALIAFLVEHLPHGIQILERSKIDQLLSERGRELKELSDSLKVEMFIIGNVSTLDIERKRSEREVAEVITTGVRKEPNPIYAQMAAKHGPDTSKWPMQPPPFIDGAAITETVRYKQGEEVLNGIMVSSVRIFEASKGAISVAREFRAVEAARDGFRDAVPIAKITYDPLELPADNEVRERLREGMVRKIADVIMSAYQERERRYMTAAENHLNRREPEKALIELACGHHYAVVAGKNIKGGLENPYVRKTMQLGLFDLTD